MAGKSYIWEKSRAALQSLQRGASDEAINLAKADLGNLDRNQLQFRDDETRETWNELLQLTRIPTERMTREQKLSFAALVFQLYDDATALKC